MTSDELLSYIKDAFDAGITDGIDLGDGDILGVGITYVEHSEPINGLLNEVYDMGVNTGQWMYQLQQDKEIK